MLLLLIDFLVDDDSRSHIEHLLHFHYLLLLIVNCVEQVTRVVRLILRNLILALSQGSIIALAILDSIFIKGILLLDERISRVVGWLSLVCSSDYFTWGIHSKRLPFSLVITEVELLNRGHTLAKYTLLIAYYRSFSSVILDLRFKRGVIN